MSGKAQKVAGGQPKAKAKKLNAASGCVSSALLALASVDWPGWQTCGSSQP